MNPELELVNTFGTPVLSKKIHSGEDIWLERNNLAPGTYILMVKENGKLKARQTIIAQ